jgi:hypothetical protein
MRKLLFILMMLLITAGYSFAQKNDKPVRPVKGYKKVVIGRSANTLWRASETEIDDGVTYYYYLRFYPVGTVIGATTSGSPNDLKRWFNRPYRNSGTYLFVGNNIKFSLSSPQGTVDYEGSIARQVLTLNVHSHINGYRSILKYSPVRKAGLHKRSGNRRR